MSLFTMLADHRDARSVVARMRAKRTEMLLGMLSSVPRPLTILDVGGTVDYWRRIGFSSPGVEIVVMNLDPPPVSLPGMRTMRGDARDLSAFPDDSIEVVFSNSVIEHVGGFTEQARMASEIRRVAQRYFIQTPNHRFPIEPHFMFPAFQYLPIDVRTFLLTRANLGWFEREPDWERARDAVSSIELLSKRQLRALFPEAEVFEERFFGFAKSLVAHHGW